MSNFSANTFGNSNRTSSNSALTEEQLKKAEAELLRRTLGWEYKNINTTNTAKVQLLQGDKDYHFLFNFLYHLY